MFLNNLSHVQLMSTLVVSCALQVLRWIHANLTWKKVLMSWMVMLVASKMVLLMLTYQYFTLTALISLQVGRELRTQRSKGL